jgi:prevent-host-death family protein
MPTISATHAKQNFAAMLDAAQREPVRIQRHERDIAVLVSAEEYEKIRRLRAQELIRLTEETSRYAESQGMTNELLEQLLADEG